ncbi:MAG: hypothetical protein K2H53_01890, partial [Clostridia bacterium]|nr:hypothetical protein [Clostridia bacterium]
IDDLINCLKENGSEIGEKEILYLIESIGDYNAAIQLKRMYEEKIFKSSNAERFRHKLENLSQEEEEVLKEYMRKSEE